MKIALEKASKLRTFSLYMAKPEVVDYGEMLTQNAHDLLANGPAFQASSQLMGDGGTLYIFPSHPRVPKWFGQLSSLFATPEKVFAQSPSGVIVFRVKGQFFGITFSYGHVYLDETKTESEFGLKATINAVSDEKLRSVERSNIGAAIRDFAQAAGQRDLRSFGFDDALDLIRKVSGRVTSGGIAEVVSGARALRFTKRVELVDVPATAIQAAALFHSTAYKQTSFKIIDFLSPVLDTSLQSKLDELLLSAICDRSGEFEMSIPEITADAMASFRFEHTGNSEFHPDLSFDLYTDSMGDRLATLAIDDLKRHRVVAHFNDIDKPALQWSVYSALVGSIVWEERRYALNEGAWYRIDHVFKDAADSKFHQLCVPPDPLLRPLKQIYGPKDKGKKVRISYQTEKSYNEEVSSESGYLLLDTRLIQIDDRPGAGTEACDLLDVAGRRFIHVKKSSRQSSVLSHFFKQGGNSAQMIRKFEPFKKAIVALVQKHYGAQRAEELQAVIDERWAIEFRIADFPRRDGTHNIPFFSKLTLQEEARNMESMGFDVRVGFINLPRIS